MVARDRLESTLANVSMVPPIVRRAFEGLLTESTAVIPPAIRSVKEFKDAELAALFSLIEQHVKQQPGDRSGYYALCQLAYAGTNGAAANLSNVLVANPLDVMPAAVGMDVMTLALDEALVGDRFEEAFDGAVVEARGWSRGCELELDLDRVALVGADARAVFADCEALLVAGRDDMRELVARDRGAVRGRGGEERGHVGPAGAIERDTDALGLVTEN